ncbi:MAG: hypothetical protein LCI00_25520 [Chloroflexi bacterium]|nr:hypothetical protein [Chloroflexota bacterium]MCC6895414.1 hypothetical protein [Anaerolineae bacterium]
MKIQTLRLKMADLVPAKAFYHDVLKLPVTTETADELVLQAGSTQLIFEREAGWQGKYHFAFEVPENKVQEAAEWLGDKVKFATLHDTTVFTSSERWNANMVYFYDPAGNILEFIGRHRQPNTSSEPFSERDMLYLSEIGLATSDVPATVAWLNDTLGLAAYDGAGSDSFSAVGDEHGLLIVVKAGRNWYPETGIPAGLYPIDITIAGADEGVYRLGAHHIRVIGED